MQKTKGADLEEMFGENLGLEWKQDVHWES